jgi:hypothetical protein
MKITIWPWLTIIFYIFVSDMLLFLVNRRYLLIKSPSPMGREIVSNCDVDAAVRNFPGTGWVLTVGAVRNVLCVIWVYKYVSFRHRSNSNIVENGVKHHKSPIFYFVFILKHILHERKHMVNFLIKWHAIVFGKSSLLTHKVSKPHGSGNRI